MNQKTKKSNVCGQTIDVWLVFHMRTMVFRLIFVCDIHHRFTLGAGNICLIFQFLWEHWPEQNRKKERERKKSLTRGHVKDIGSAKGIRSYREQGYEGAIAGKCF